MNPGPKFICYRSIRNSPSVKNEEYKTVFLSCGDSLYDVFLSDGSSAERTAESDPNTQSGTGQTGSTQTRVELAGNAGGSPMNVAVGLARLGHDSSYLTKLSTDLFGVRLRRFLHTNNLGTDLCIDTDLNTTLAIVETASDGSANYSFYIDNTADVNILEAELPEQIPDKIKILHFGSYSTTVDPTAASLKDLANREKDRLFISYDPNLRTSIEPDIDRWRESFNSFASCAGLIKASDEDIEQLLGKNKEAQFVADCFSHGAKLVYITRGPDGASAYSPEGDTANVAGVTVDVVDTVGAGDTFQAAIIHWLITHRHIAEGKEILGRVDLKASTEFAISAAAVTCSRSGADLPHLAELG